MENLTNCPIHYIERATEISILDFMVWYNGSSYIFAGEDKYVVIGTEGRESLTGKELINKYNEYAKNINNNN